MNYKELAKHTKDLTILYAEDDKMTLNIITEILKGLFKEVTTAVNGEEAITEYNKKKYDIVLLDIEMPILDGIEAAKRIKLQNSNQSILFLTAYDEVKYIRTAVDIGADDYILKPLDEHDFFVKIYNVIQEQKGLETRADETIKELTNKDVNIRANVEHDLKHINVLLITENFEAGKADNIHLFLEKLVGNILIEDDATFAFEKYKDKFVHEIDLLILNTELLRVKGFAFISAIRKLNKDIPYLFISKNESNREC
jgi:DNA-binding response OmpR family regulator